MDLTQEKETVFKYLKNEQNLWQIADTFRELVCAALRNLEAYERIMLKGDYLFKIDDASRFIVMVDEDGAWSIKIKNEIKNEFSVDSGCPWIISDQQISNVMSGSSRTTILTDSVTLYQLLTGHLRAHKAFVTEKVMISGDLAAFLKMVSLLKRSGVKSKYESIIQS